MKISQLKIEKIENCDPFNKRAKENDMVTECMADAKRYCKLNQKGS